MRIIFSRNSHKWLKRFNICFKSLKKILKELCYKEGIPSNKTLFINIRKYGYSDFDICKNKINVCVDTLSKNRNLKIRRMVRNLLHELRHYIQYKIQMRPARFSYSLRDMIDVSDKYWFASEEVDARRYEVRKLKFVLKRLKKGY